MKPSKAHAKSKAPPAARTPPSHKPATSRVSASANARKPPPPPQSSSDDDDNEDEEEGSASDEQEFDSDSDGSGSGSESEPEASSAERADLIAALRARYAQAADSESDEDDEQDEHSAEDGEEDQESVEEDSEQDDDESEQDSEDSEQEGESAGSEEEGLSFAELAQRRESMGKKAYLESMAEQERQRAGGKRTAKPKRVNKNAPMEMTSKRPVSRFREAVKVPKIERRDPRFDNLSGHFNQGLFDKAYGFVYDLRSQEIHQLKQQLAKEKDYHQAQQLMRTIQAMENRERARKETDVKQRIKRDWRKQELEKVKEGKKPFFLKQSEQKKLYLINKLKGRTDSELDKVAEKKRKRDAGKDWKWMPKRRRTGDGGA